MKIPSWFGTDITEAEIEEIRKKTEAFEQRISEYQNRPMDASEEEEK